MKWVEFVGEGVIDWLLESSNPSIRFWALQHLKDMDMDHPDVVAAQKAVMKSPCVKTILGAQKSEGHWGNPDNMYEPKCTAHTHNLLILAELGAKRTAAIERGIESIFRFQRDSGHFLIEAPKTERGRASIVKDGCCLDGNILYFMNHFGYHEDPRVKRLIEFQMEYHSDDVGGWKCRAYPIDRSRVFPENCFMGGVKMLRGLASIPAKKRSKRIREIIDQEIEIILENRIYRYLRAPDGSRKDKAGWKRFGFPTFYQSDALEALDLLTGLGVHDERMQDAIDLVIAKRPADGKWLLKDSFNGKMLCDIEVKHKPSKWITLRALKVLRRYYGE